MVVILEQTVLFVAIALGYFYLAGRRDFKVIKSLAFALNVTVLAFLLITFGFIWKPIFVYRWAHKPSFYLLLALITGFALLICAGISALITNRQAKRLAKTGGSPTSAKRALGGRIVISVLSVLFLFVGGLAFFVPFWFNNYFGSVTADQFIFLVTSGNGDATAEANANVANYMTAPVILVAALGLQIGFWQGKLRKRLLGLGCTLLAAIVAVVYALNALPIVQAINSQVASSPFLEHNYVDPAKVVKFPEKKRNLIHIYMESVENSYYDDSHGGYSKDNLMPQLQKLNETNLHFSNRPDTLGGPHQTFGSVHSAAAMVNMEAGVPMKTSINGGEGKMTYPDFVTIGELLHRQGYNTELMMGADSSWGSLGDYYRKHGDFLVFDHPYAIKNGYLDKNYHVWWGYEDDKIYEYAKKEIRRLADTGKPFYFILENADTHFPDGYKSPNMTQEPFSSQYANVIFYSQNEVVKFVQWCQSQDFYENTTILITGDHQSMDTNFFKGWDPKYERTIVNMYLNPAKTVANPKLMQNRQFAPFDLFPTTLAAIGADIEGDRAGLGTNLLSGRKTLIEEKGLAEVNENLMKRSDFYFSYRQR